MQLWGSISEILMFTVFVLFCWRLLLHISLFRRAVFTEVMFTMASSAVENLPLEEQLPLGTVGHFHEARNTPCFIVLIRKEYNVPHFAIDKMIENVGLLNHLFHYTKPSGLQNKLPIRDELFQLYCYKLYRSTLCLYPLRVGNSLKTILFKCGIPSLINLFCVVQISRSRTMS